LDIYFEGELFLLERAVGGRLGCLILLGFVVALHFLENGFHLQDVLISLCQLAFGFYALDLES